MATDGGSQRLPEPFVRTMLAQCVPERVAQLQQVLNRHGHDVTVAGSPDDALRLGHEMDLLIVGVDGDDESLELCRRLRSHNDTALVAVSDVDTERERLRVLRAGCDDHLHTHCGPAEIMARLDAVLRWVQPAERVAAPVTHGALTIDGANREVTLDGRRVHLTRKEHDLLALLATNADTILERAVILDAIWPDGSGTSRTLNTHVSSLRRKLGRWVCVTVKGYGVGIGQPDDDNAATQPDHAAREV